MRTEGQGATRLRAGVAKVDITNVRAKPVNDPLYARALVVTDGETTLVLATVDAVAIAEIGTIPNEFLENVRARLHADLNLQPEHLVINASHCHGIVCDDIEDRVVRAVAEACEAIEPVRAGAGVGHEDRITENRRVKLADGGEADVRRAYALVDDKEVVGVGPLDTEIGILRLDREDGRTLAVVYNFAIHPILGVPNGGNTGDVTGFASTVIEENLDDGAVALFVQGCAGDVNPIFHKIADHFRNAEPLGNTLGLSTLKAIRQTECSHRAVLRVVRETLALPRADLAGRIDQLAAEQIRLVESLKGTNLNFKAFLPLFVKYQLSPDYPSYYSYRYLHEEKMGTDDQTKLDARNRESLQNYVDNIAVMEELTRIGNNIALLKRHEASREASGKETIDVEVVGLRIGDFVLVTFPGELSAQTGLDIKESSSHELTFVAGVTNGYIYYTPTAEQLNNVGRAQEDSDCLVAPEWEAVFKERVAEILEAL